MYVSSPSSTSAAPRTTTIINIIINLQPRFVE
jgi:hypothetical protein